MLAEIRQVFGNIKRGDGATLHETKVIDAYGSDEARRRVRRNDTDRRWWEVRDEWIEAFGGVGGLSFLDAAGFRYYCPAYMSYWLRTGQEPDMLALELQNDRFWNFEAIFLPREKAMIARFLDYVRVHFNDREAKKALEKYWGRYLAATNET